MKFKVGDMVRLTRKGIKEIYGIWTDHNPVLIQWWVIEKIEDNLLSIDWTKKLIHKDHFEPIPEEPEFKYWEEIEVRNEGDDKWWKAIFLFYLPETFGYRYLCVKGYSSTIFKIWGCFETAQRECARKLKQALTRKEIAEKFWVSEDFVLID